MSKASGLPDSGEGRRSAAPKRDQIAEHFRRLIRDGELSEGDSLPAELDTARQFGVARGTVRAAIQKLVGEGLVQRRRGKGTWVSSVRFEQYLGRLSSFSEDMRARGFEPGARLLSLEKVAPALAISSIFGQREPLLWKMTRVRLANDLPIGVEVTYLSTLMFDALALEVAAAGSLYETFAAHGWSPSRARQSIKAILLARDIAEVLGVQPGEPAFQQERITYDENDNVLEVVDSIYRAEFLTLNVDLRRV